MLHINDVVFRFGGRILFEGATLHIAAGQKVGLVGRNGSGKSTLFKLILGEMAPDDGEITVRPRVRIGRVAQEAPGGETTPLEHVLAADTERVALLAEADAAPDPNRIADIHDRLNTIDAHTGPARAAAILAGLGFNEAAQNRPLRGYSGGWRMRVALAATLFARPDLLFLDEPTNHLDLEATLWLTEFLAGWAGTLLVISHDRDLLNDVTNRIAHIDGGRLVAYGGNYDTFERTRREKMDLAAKAYGKQMEQRRKIQSFVDRFRAKATKAAQAQSRLKMLEKMGPAVPVVSERAIVFDFPDPDPLPPPVLTIEDGTAGYGDQAILTRVNLRIDMDDRIALLGANGNGKSTLAKVLSGRLGLMAGKLSKPPRLRIGYFAQHQTEELSPQKTAYHHMAELMPQAAESKVRAHLGRFGFEQDRADVVSANLSGGEKARLVLALMTRDAPHLMILDEPTNHLDIDSREALTAALNVYEGAVILISHDPHLIEAVADRLWVVEDGRLSDFDGDLADYRRRLTERGQTPRCDDRAALPSRKDERRAAAANRARLAPLKKQVETAEKTLERLHRDQAALEAALADPALYRGPAEAVTKLRQDQTALAKSLALAEEAWLAAHEAYDDAAAQDD